MLLNFYTLLSLFSIFITTILILFFLFTKKGYKVENKILAALLSVFNFQILFSFLTGNYTAVLFLEWHKPIFLLRQTSLLIGPLIYFYVDTFLKNKNHFKKYDLLHLIPFSVVFIYLIFFYYGESRFVYWQSNLDLYTTIIITVHILIYIVFSIISMKKKNISFKSLFLSIGNSSHNIWIQFILLGFILIWIFNLNTLSLVMIVNKIDWCAYTTSIYSLIVFLFTNVLLLILLLKPEGFFINKKFKNIKSKEIEKYDLIQKLTFHMENNKAFLNPELSLESLANELYVHPRFLSQLINDTFQKSFKGYILDYRIKESMNLLKDINNRKLTIQEIFYKAGFNSKSSFNNQFKLYTNLTPLEFREKHLSLEN